MVRRRYLLIGSLSLAIFLVGAFLVMRAVGFRPAVEHRLDLSQGESIVPSSTEATPTLRIAVSAMISPRSTFESYAGLADYIAQSVGMRSELTVRKTYAEVNDLVLKDQIDVAFICTGAFVEESMQGKAKLLVAPVVRGQENYSCYILVPMQSPARSLDDLRGKRFAYVDEMSNTGRGAPRRLLASRGYDPENFFAETVLTGSHDKSIHAVATNGVDGAAVDHLIYEAFVVEGHEDVSAVRVIEKIGPFGMPPIVVSALLNPELAQRIYDAFIASGDDPDAREFLDPLGIDRFRTPVLAEYEAVTDTRTIQSVVVGRN